MTNNTTPETPSERDPADEVVTALYRRFKDWSRRGFGPDDVTWCEVKADVERLVAAALSQPAPVGWQPIETAPKDGSNVLLFCPRGDGNPGSTYRVTEGSWFDDPGGVIEHRDMWGRWIDQDERDGFTGWMTWDGGFSEDTMMPTHWRPLPEPPALDASGADHIATPGNKVAQAGWEEGSPNRVEYERGRVSASPCTSPDHPDTSRAASEGE